MLRLLEPIEVYWKELASCLLKDELQYKIKDIEADCFHDTTSVNALDDALSKWLKTTKRAKRTWQTLCEISKKYGDESLEQYIQENDGLKSKF